jgi:UPF0042 nucleotide-binding protein
VNRLTPPPRGTVPESLVVVTGLSGSGKSYVNKCLEDMGYFCVDNLPLELVEPLLGQISATRVGIILDVRNPDFALRFPEILGRLRTSVPGTRLLFLDASEESLIRRFSETRRPHPLAGRVSLLEALRRERAMLEEVRAVADVVVDTSAMTVHELRSFMQKTFVGDPESGGMIVSATSFGYKFGIPHDVDLLFDVRFLANPHFVPELKGKTGMDAAVAAYIEKDPETKPFLDRLVGFLDYLLPRYDRERKSYLSIGIGCTGGKHRSVYIVEQLSKLLQERGYPVRVSHRDATRE